MANIKESYLKNQLQKRCCSCRACEQICPQKCISMEYKNGFLYPKVDRERCVNCGLCYKVCQFSKENEKKYSLGDVLAGWTKDDDVIMKSTSGGIFPILAMHMIQQGGYVFGAVFNDNFEVELQGINDPVQIARMQGSKYVRSDTKDTYSKVTSLLGKGVPILYTGTPCQIAGLRSFLVKDYSNLICVDLVCHGMPSEIVFQKYKKYLENKYKSKIEEFRFRNKREGMMKSEYFIKFANGKEIHESLDKNQYSLTYNSLIAHMPSCTDCQYATMERVSDITIGDFWGIENYNAKATNEKGTSVILLNTLKGKEYFKLVQQNCNFFFETAEHAKKNNPPLNHSIKKHPMSEKFLLALEKNSFEPVYKKYIFWGNKWMLFYRLWRKIKGALLRS